MMLFARNEAANKWLAEHPGVLGAGALVLGLVLLGIGISALVRGRARSKYGVEFRGAQAKWLGLAWTVAGVFCCLFGVYKLIVAVL